MTREGVTERTLDRYRILGELGRGGMGVVYEALDTTLGRHVALKLLPPERVADPDRRERFLQEARAASALDHPAIVTVHDLGRAEGCDFIVMELVRGETLADRIARGRLPVPAALRIAVQVADALARAHAAGIVHRDLKPSNVMVTPEGNAKILDFGLAKLVEPTTPLETIAETLSIRRATVEHAIVGTVPYMSPEQADGRAVDARSDIFAFGVLVYEMLSGRHPFRQPTALETLSAIRSAEPLPPGAEAPDIPLEAERLVLRCLQKAPARRWQSMADMKVVLEDCIEDSGSGPRRETPSPLARPRRRFPLAAGIGAAAAVAAVAAATVFLLRRPPTVTGPLELHRLTYDSGFTMGTSLSRDGKIAAYASDRAGGGNIDVWVQHVAQRSPVRLTRHPAEDAQPNLSPDGSRVVFRSERDGGGIWIVNTLGGEERLLVAGGVSPRFTPDGASILYFGEPSGGGARLRKMFLIPADGGPSRPVLPAFGLTPTFASAVLSPDGKRVLFVGARWDAPRKSDWWVAPLSGGDAVPSGAARFRDLLDVVQVPVAWIPGWLLLASGTTLQGINLYRVPISPEGLVSGSPEALTSGPGMTMDASVAEDGTMAISRFTWIVHLWAVDLDPATGKALGAPRRLTTEVGPKFDMSLARDGSRLVYSTFSGTRENRLGEIRMLDLASGQDAMAVARPSRRAGLTPRLDAEAKRLGWTDLVDGKPAVCVAPTTAAAGREVCRDCELLGFLNEPGRALVSLPGGRGVAILALGSGALAPVLAPGGGSILDADASHDDRWLAASLLHADGTEEIRVLPLEAGGDARGFSVARSATVLGPPRWSDDGRFLYFHTKRDDRVCIWGQPLDPATKRAAGEPFPLVHLHENSARIWGPRATFTLDAGRGRLVFNAAEGRGDVYLARLPRP